MIALQQVNIRELDRSRLRFKLPSWYYNIVPYIPIEHSDIPKAESFDFPDAVPEQETIAQTFARKELAGKRVYFERVQRRDRVEPLRVFPGGWYHHENMIIPDDFVWGELVGEIMSFVDMSQTELSPIGIAPRKDISDFLNRAGIR